MLVKEDYSGYIQILKRIYPSFHFNHYNRISNEYISSHDTKIKNQGDQNTFAGAQPQAQQLQGGRPGPFGGFGGNRNRVSYTEAVVPHTKNYGTIKKQFTLTLPENSIGIIKLTPTK